MCVLAGSLPAASLVPIRLGEWPGLVMVMPTAAANGVPLRPCRPLLLFGDADSAADTLLCIACPSDAPSRAAAPAPTALAAAAACPDCLPIEGRAASALSVADASASAQGRTGTTFPGLGFRV